MASKW